MDKEKEHLPRRTVLKSLALALGGVATLPLLSRLLTKKPLHDPTLPGEGSIFQPRRDANLEAWERTHGRPPS